MNGEAGPAGSLERPPGFGVVAVFARLVPESRRSEWLAEWRAELAYAYEDAQARNETAARIHFRLWRRALGALRDARWLRSVYGAPRGGGGAFREATRVIRRQPGFTLMVVGTLALGIGAATSIFSVIDGLMLRPLPFREPDRLVEVEIERGNWFSPYLDQESTRAWRSQDAVFEAVHAHSSRSLTLTAPGEPRPLRASLVEPGFLRMLGTPPLLGREFLPEEAIPGRDRVVMLGHDVWRLSFASDAAIIGRTIFLDDEPYTVVGVMPPTLRRLPGGIPLLALPLTDPPPSTGSVTMMLGRLRADVPLAVAQERLDAVSPALAVEQPRDAGWGVQLAPLERFLQEGARRGLTALGVAVVLLLLVACVNAAGLLFVRGVARRSDMSVRRALGASPGTLFRQALAESLVFALLAGVAGMALAWWGVRILTALAPESLLLFSYTPVTIDVRVLAFSFVVTFVVGLAFGVGPAVRAARATALSTSRRSTTASRGEARLRSLVQAVQIALAVLLLTAAGLFARSFLALTAVDLGFDTRNLLALSYDLPQFRYPEAEQRAAFNVELDARLRTLPGVRDLTWTGGGVTGGGFRSAELEVEGVPRVTADTELLPYASADTAYFRVMDIRFREGRAFRQEDLVAEAGAVIIDVDLAARLWPGQSALGRRFRTHATGEWLTVVGVTNDVKLIGPDDPLGPFMMYYPTSVERLRGPSIVIRTAGDPSALAPAVRQILQSMDPGLPIGRLDTAERLLGQAVQQPRFLLFVMTTFAAVALFLAAIGVYGLVAFTVARRTREFGIRVAIGARGSQILTSVFVRGFAIAAVGLVIGLVGAAAFSRFVRGLLFGISPLDGVTLVAVTVVLGLACAAALIVPARRAAGVDAAEALRTE